MLYGLPKEMIHASTWPLGDIFVRDLLLAKYPEEIAKEAKVDMTVAYGIAYEVNRRIFLRFPEYFTDAEALGRQWETQKTEPLISLEEAKRKVLELEPWLLEEDEEEDESDEPMTATVKLPLLRAVGEYPNIGNQQITRERIKIKGRQDDVRPSLANWVKAYRNELGVGYHEPVVRAKFLFDSENGKKLSSEERERLNVIIRSIEENEPVEIDTDRGEIVFPEVRVVERAPKPEPRKQQVSRSASAVEAGRAGQSKPNVSSRPLMKPAPEFSESRPSQSKSSHAPAAAVSGRGSVRPIFAPRRQGASVSPVAPPDLPVSDSASRSDPVSLHSTGGTVSFSSGHALPGERSRDKGSYVRYGRTPLPTASSDPSSAPTSRDGRVVDLRGE